MKRLNGKERFAFAAGAVAAGMLLFGSCGGSAAAEEGGGQTPVQEKVLIGGSFWNAVAVVNRSAGDSVEWRYRLPRRSECNSVDVVPGTGDVLLSYRRGARVVKRDSTNGGGTVVWDYTDVAEGEELQTARVLPDGGYLLAICGTPARIVELDSTGREVRREVRFDLGIEPAHSQFRRVAKAANGNYLIPVITAGKVVEIDSTGNRAGVYEVGGVPFSVQELAGGNLLVALGSGHSAVEIARGGSSSGAVVNRIDSVAGVPLHFVAQTERLANGNTLIANWQGYLQSGDPTTAQLVEIDPAGAVVWTFDGRGGRPVRHGAVDFVSTFCLFSE
ncbi:MAG: hypothetical protein J1E79_03475 [Rikenella sp.]|nr:hypothetical protein [Rikenella sp.]